MVHSATDHTCASDHRDEKLPWQEWMQKAGGHGLSLEDAWESLNGLFIIVIWHVYRNRVQLYTFYMG